MHRTAHKREELLIFRKLQKLPFLFMLLILLISSVGFLLLYSAAKGNIDPWASRQMFHFAIGVFAFVIVAIIDIRFWFQFSYFIYLCGLGLLLMTTFAGVEGGLGAQRWLNIGGFQFQPSELAKVCMVMAVARYYQMLHINNIQKITGMIIPAILILFAALLVFKQPNLGTASIMAITGGAMLFMAGVSWKKFALAALVVVIALPVAWNAGVIKNYQKQRVITFLNPEQDPLGSGYNIIQSKIAIGSGGVAGKGFLKGTQSQLSFVPERQTDFIFSILAEEWGFTGGVLLIILYGLLVFTGLRIAVSCESMFGQLLAYGVITVMFVHVFVNMGMVMGILPVVGVPLPLVSYGGSSMVSTLAGLGFVANVWVHRRVKL